MIVLMIYGGCFELDKCFDEIEVLEGKMHEPNFWDDKSTSESVISELTSLRKRFESVSSLKSMIKDNLDMLDLLKNEYDEELFNLVNITKDSIEESLDK
jgi:protein subunit release factor A